MAWEDCTTRGGSSQSTPVDLPEIVHVVSGEHAGSPSTHLMPPPTLLPNDTTQTKPGLFFGFHEIISLKDNYHFIKKNHKTRRFSTISSPLITFIFLKHPCQHQRPTTRNFPATCQRPTTNTLPTSDPWLTPPPLAIHHQRLTTTSTPSNLLVTRQHPYHQHSSHRQFTPTPVSPPPAIYYQQSITSISITSDPLPTIHYQHPYYTQSTTSTSTISNPPANDIRNLLWRIQLQKIFNELWNVFFPWFYILISFLLCNIFSPFFSGYLFRPFLWFLFQLFVMS